MKFKEYVRVFSHAVALRSDQNVQYLLCAFSLVLNALVNTLTNYHFVAAIRHFRRCVRYT